MSCPRSGWVGFAQLGLGRAGLVWFGLGLVWVGLGCFCVAVACVHALWTRVEVDGMLWRELVTKLRCFAALWNTWFEVMWGREECSVGILCEGAQATVDVWG